MFRMEELAEKLGFEFTLDLLGDDQVAGATRSANADRTVRSAAAVLKNHARSYMKQAKKDELTLLQVISRNKPQTKYPATHLFLEP